MYRSLLTLIILGVLFGRPAEGQKTHKGQEKRTIYQTQIGSFVLVSTAPWSGSKQKWAEALITPGQKTITLYPTCRPDGFCNSDQIDADDIVQRIVSDGRHVYLLTMKRLYVWKGERLGFQDAGLPNPPVKNIHDMTQAVPRLFTLVNEKMDFAGLLYLDSRKHVWRTFRYKRGNLGGVISARMVGRDTIQLEHFAGGRYHKATSTFSLKAWAWKKK